ncbi:hypothetical protein DENIS_1829 [Desulfonema ishimotonii]|uniref:Transposase n=1 Tax=Desulfonema ishimotonii TaxID=45657 RepID=A0A401FV77_9BACT|nr:hypothetical protein [Desulfonema ishimotonii]GBC60870.1 hypothetical protein DENIS_1829 [Desulfonema ishimotonii]
MRDIGIDISVGQISNILIGNKEVYHAEKEAILTAGLQISNYVGVDDTGCRHQGRNGYCTYVGNDLFAWSESTESKSRISFLKILRGVHGDYILTSGAIDYMADRKLPLNVLSEFSDLIGIAFRNETQWLAKLAKLEITSERHIRIATEGALVGSVSEHGFNPHMVILSDDAGQFNVFLHALCRIHAERTINRLSGFDDERRRALEKKQTEIWEFYSELKQYTPRTLVFHGMKNA